MHKSGAHFPIRSSSSRLRYRRHPRIRGERSARAPASVWSFRTVVISFLFIIVLSLKGICQVIPGLQSLGLLSGQINFCGNPLCLRYHLGNVGLMESLYNTLCSALLGEGSGAAEAQTSQIKPLHFGGLWGDSIWFLLHQLTSAIFKIKAQSSKGAGQLLTKRAVNGNSQLPKRRDLRSNYQYFIFYPLKPISSVGKTGY